MPPPRRPVKMDEAAMKANGVQPPAESTPSEAPLLQPEPETKPPAPSPAKPMLPAKTVQNQSVTKSSGFTEDLPSWMEGDFNQRDKGFPLLSIFQKESEKYPEGHDFRLGDLIYDSQHKISSLRQEPGTYFILTNWRKYYEEVVDFDSGKRSKIFETETEARASGVEYRPAAFMTMLVLLPEGMDIPDAITLDGYRWIETGMFFTKTAYPPVSKALFKAVRDLGSSGKKGAYITTDKIVKEKNVWAAPIVTFAENLTSEWPETLAHVGA